MLKTGHSHVDVPLARLDMVHDLVHVFMIAPDFVPVFI